MAEDGPGDDDFAALDGMSQERLEEENCSLLHTVEKLARQEALTNGVQVSAEAVTALKSVFSGYVEELAVDLEHFARHAKRVIVCAGRTNQ